MFPLRLPEEYDNFNPYELANGKSWLVLLIETQRHHKAFPKKIRIQDYELKKCFNTMLALVKNNSQTDFTSSYQSYMHRFSIYNPYKKEKYFTRIEIQNGKTQVFWKPRFDLIDQRIEAEKTYSSKNFKAVYEKHGAFYSPGKVKQTATNVALWHSEPGISVSGVCSCDVTKANDVKKPEIKPNPPEVIIWKLKKEEN